MRSFFIFTAQTFKDLLRERILYNILFVAIFLLFFGYLAALLVFGHQERVMLHIGTAVNSLSVFFVGMSAGARSVRIDLDQRWAYLPLSRPVSRSSYFFGKWAGICGFVALNLILLSAVLAGAVIYTHGVITLSYFQSMGLIFAESSFIVALAISLSLLLRTGLVVMFTVAYLFLAHNHEQMDFLKTQGSDSFGIFSFLQKITPQGHVLLMDTRVYYHMPLETLEWTMRFSYGFIWAFLFLCIGNAIFYRKNL